ncbi:MAG TPA: hypothetical protein VF251_00275 [Pyrinomonadaceae bacterium]
MSPSTDLSVLRSFSVALAAKLEFPKSSIVKLVGLFAGCAEAVVSKTNSKQGVPMLLRNDGKRQNQFCLLLVTVSGMVGRFSY